VNFLFYVPQMATYGGIERHVCVLAEEAAKRNHRVRLLTTSNSLNEAARASLLGYGVEFRELPRARDQVTQWAKLVWLTREVLAAKMTRWDVIYTNGQSALATVIWRAAGRRTRIIHHHHTAADASEQRTWSAAFRKVLQRAPEIVGCSLATCANIAAATGRTGIRYLPYFTACPVQAAEVQDTPYAAGSPLSFGFIGRLIETKGIGMICELSQRPELSAITWHIYGSGPDYPDTFFQAYPRIRYHGPYRDLARYGEILLDLDAVSLFSIHNEGMPLSLIESMSAGLPWIASDKGGTRELAGRPDNCVIVRDPSNVATTAEDVLTLADRICSGRTSRVAQRGFYDECFAPGRVAELWFNFLEGARTPAAAAGIA
jgi:glycosyltransferase involved in cell wall biosynthesis